MIITTPSASSSVSLFLSYAHEDEVWLEKLRSHLSLLRRRGIITDWYDRQLVPGTDWSRTIDQRIEQASLILLLVSADFLASDYCYEVELRRALQLHEAGRARVIPIAIRPVDWTGAPFAHLQALPKDAKPLSSWHDPDAALVDVVAGLRRALDDLAFSPTSTVRQTLPPIWMIPYPRNHFFLGRDVILEHLHTCLCKGQATALSQSPSAISGLGGIGKTQIAIEYAYRFHQEYEAILWARADTYEDLMTSFLGIAARLRLPERGEKEQEIIIAAVKSWLQTHQRWLMILDNADNLDLLPTFVPQTAGGHLMITTRSWDLQRLAIRFEVEPLSLEQGAILLTLRAGLLATESDWKQLSTDDRSVAMLLVHQLGGLPLALDQAGAYIEATGCSLRAYEELYRTHRLAVLQDRRSRVLDHPEGVMTTWSLSFQQVQKMNPAAAELLHLCAFCAPDAIAEEILTVKPELLGPLLAPLGANALQLNQAIEALRTYSLIRRDPKEKTLSVHRLVQAVLRDKLKEKEQQMWAARAMQAILAAFPWPKHATWERCERLLVQALNATEGIEQYCLPTWEAAQLLNASGAYLSDRARYAEAEPLQLRALRIWEQTLGPEHPSVAATLNGLALLYTEQGKYGEAELLYQRAFHIWEQSPERDRVALAAGQNNLALLYTEQGKYEAAERLYQRAIGLWDQSLGPGHPQVEISAAALNGLAGLSIHQGKYGEAETLYQQAMGLCLWDQSLGPMHSLVAYSFNGLAVLSIHQGKHEEAEAFYQQALHIWEQSLGPEHPQVAAALDNLADMYTTVGEDGEAEPLYQRALHIWEQSLGPEHPNVAVTLNGLASLYAKQDKDEEAESFYQRALHILEQSLGPEHPNVAVTLSGLASLYADQDKDKETESFYQRALHILEQSLGPEHPNVATTLNGLASLYAKQGRYTEAEPLYLRALHIREQGLEPEHPQIIASLNGLANLYTEQGRYTEAEPLYLRALHIWEQNLGPEHPLTRQIQNNYTLFLRAMGSKQEP